MKNLGLDKLGQTWYTIYMEVKTRKGDNMLKTNKTAELQEALYYAIKDLESFMNTADAEGRIVAPDSVYRQRLAIYKDKLAKSKGCYQGVK